MKFTLKEYMAELRTNDTTRGIWVNVDNYNEEWGVHSLEDDVPKHLTFIGTLKDLSFNTPEVFQEVLPKVINTEHYNVQVLKALYFTGKLHKPIHEGIVVEIEKLIDKFLATKL
jgi:hypothetical protein